MEQKDPQKDPQKDQAKKPTGRPKGSKDKKPRKKRVDRGTHHNTFLPNNRLEAIKLPDGYNTNKIRFMRMIMPTEKLDVNDVEEMRRRFYRYLELCEEYDQKIGNQAAYAAIGLTKEQVWEFVNRRNTNPARGDFLKSVQQICGMYREGLMEDGKVNPVTGIFWQKNYDGMKDQQEVVLTPNQNVLGDGIDAERLKQKYLENAEIAERPILEIEDQGGPEALPGKIDEIGTSDALGVQ